MTEPKYTVGRLMLGEDAGGKRHFIDDRPISCGAHIELAAVDSIYDPETGLPHHEHNGQWVGVRYECALYRDPPLVTLYADVGGYAVKLGHTESMLFRVKVRR